MTPDERVICGVLDDEPTVASLTFFENSTTRRLVTFPGLYLGLLALTLLLPLLLPLAAIVDATRWLLARRPAMALRLTTFAWIYLVGEAWALLLLLVLGLRPKGESLDATYRAQSLWLDWNFEALRLVFDLSFEVSGSEDISPGPILLLSRHASIIDTMLPGRYVVKPHGIRLRYVLKKELLADPALDLGGQRLPNHFVDRGGNTAEELAALRGLATTLDTDEGVIIYPEGTRFSEAKRLRYIEPWKGQSDPLGDIAGSYRKVLPPRPAGTLAMIEASDADVVVLAHRGLEGFARVKDLWSGDIVGSRIDIAFWRIPRHQIPVDRERQQLWLFELWSQVDAWVVGEVEAGRPWI